MRNRNVVVAGLIAAVFVACSGPMAEQLGGAMVDAGSALEDGALAMRDGAAVGAMSDAGRMLSDAGNALIDAGRKSDGGAAAAAPTVLDTECDIESGRRTTTIGSGAWTETVDYYAEATAPTGEAEWLAGTVALLCSWERIGSDQTGVCPVDAICDDIGDYPISRAECRLTTEIDIQGATLRVHCGGHSDGDDRTKTGYRWRSVRFFVPARP